MLASRHPLGWGVRVLLAPQAWAWLASAGLQLELVTLQKKCHHFVVENGPRRFLPPALASARPGEPGWKEEQGRGMSSVSSSRIYSLNRCTFPAYDKGERNKGTHTFASAQPRAAGSAVAVTSHVWPLILATALVQMERGCKCKDPVQKKDT